MMPPPSRSRNLLMSFSLCLCAAVVPPAVGQPAIDKATLAWTLPWDADWVTAVAFVGPKRLAAGNNLGDILVWDLPDKAGDPAPKPTRRLAGHDNSVNRLVTTPDQRWLISASNDHTVRCWDLQAEAGDAGVVALNSRAIQNAEAKKKKTPAP